MPAVPDPIQRMVDATNAADTEAFVGCFTEDAHLEDWGRAFQGRDGVRSWNATDNIGVHMHFELVGVEPSGPEWLVTARSTSDRFNGTGVIRITLAGDRISRLVIAPD